MCVLQCRPSTLLWYALYIYIIPFIYIHIYDISLYLLHTTIYLLHTSSYPPTYTLLPPTYNTFTFCIYLLTSSIHPFTSSIHFAYLIHTLLLRALHYLLHTLIRSTGPIAVARRRSGRSVCPSVNICNSATYVRIFFQNRCEYSLGEYN